MNLFARLEKSKDFWFLFLTCVIFFVLRFPSLFEPHWYGDEGIYQAMATAMNHGSLLYRDIWDNKPPLLYVIYALFNGDQFSLRLLSLIAGILSIIVFFFLAKKVVFLNTKTIYTQKLPLYSATALFAFLFGLPLFEGNIANAENFILLPILTAALLTIRFFQKAKRKALFYAGILLSLAFICKTVAIFDLAAFVLFLLFVNYKSVRSLARELLVFLPLLYGFLIPLCITVFFFILQKELMPFLSGAFGQNIDYVGYKNTLFIPQGFLYLKLLLVFSVLIFLFFQRKKLLPGSLLVYLWLTFSVCSTFFSGRPYTHYILVLLPSFCLFVLLLIFEIQQNREKQNSILPPLTFFRLTIGVLLIFLVFQNFDIYKRNVGYYQNFALYLFNQKSITAYQQFFDPNTPRDYELAQFLKTHTKKNDIVFLWGNSAQVYKMSETLPPGRFTVAFHIINSKERLKETAKALEIKKPRFIIVYPSQNYPFNLSSYRYVYSIQGANIYESLF